MQARQLKESDVGSISFDDSGSIVTINQYDIKKPLGKGSFAEVYLCGDRNTNEDYAVKVFNKSLLRRRRTMARTSCGVQVHSELEKVEREIAIMKKLVHPNLVSLYEVIDDHDDDQLYMFMEYVELGPVMTYDKATHTFRSRVTGGACGEDSSALYLLDVAAGLRYLHTHDIAHRDLKPDNVLLSVHGHCKIADFGVAHYFDSDRQKAAVHSVALLERSKSRAQMMETQGTYCFWAPEMVDVDHAFNAYACDMWAAGVCLYIFLTGMLPFYDDTVTVLFDKIRQAEYAKCDSCSPDAQRIVAGLLTADVSKRLTVQDLETDQWLKKIEQTVEPDDLSEMLGRPSTCEERPSSLSPTKHTVNQTDIESAFSKLTDKTRSACSLALQKIYGMSSRSADKFRVTKPPPARSYSEPP